MSFEIPEGFFGQPTGDGDCQSEVFFAKFISGVGIESLILEDAHFQRKTACMLRKSQREQRRKLVKAAVKKMKEAAEARSNSAVLGTVLKIGAAAFECTFGADIKKELCGSLGPELGEKVADGINKGVSAIAEGLANCNPFEKDATEKDCEAKLLQDSADAERDQASDTTDWLESARELERRVIDHLENINSTKHKTQLTANGG